MTTPGQSSGTTTFTLSNSAIVTEAFDRIGVRLAQLDRHHLVSARVSLNLELQSWSNRGINLWKMTSGTISLVAGTATYTLPTSLVTLTEMWFTTVDMTGGANSTDRFMVPITREEYAMIPTKTETGSPMQYWFQRLLVPQVTMWQPPAEGAPNYVVNWFGLSRIGDAGISGGETPDIVYRGLDALCAGLAKRLASKFAPQRLQEKAAEFTEAWNLFAMNDQETGPTIIVPNVAGYWRI